MRGLSGAAVQFGSPRQVVSGNGSEMVGICDTEPSRSVSNQFAPTCWRVLGASGASGASSRRPPFGVRKVYSIELWEKSLSDRPGWIDLGADSKQIRLNASEPSGKKNEPKEKPHELAI